MHAYFTDTGSQNLINLFFLFISPEVENIHSHFPKQVHSSLSFCTLIYCSMLTFSLTFFICPPDVLVFCISGFLLQCCSTGGVFGGGQFHMARNLLEKVLLPRSFRIPWVIIIRMSPYF